MNAVRLSFIENIEKRTSAVPGACLEYVNKRFQSELSLENQRLGHG